MSLSPLSSSQVQQVPNTCYWVSFSAHRPSTKKEGHHANRRRFDAWVYWNRDRWNVLPFTNVTLDDDLLILMESWKKMNNCTSSRS